MSHPYPLLSARGVQVERVGAPPYYVWGAPAGSMPADLVEVLGPAIDYAGRPSYRYMTRQLDIAERHLSGAATDDLRLCDDAPAATERLDQMLCWMTTPERSSLMMSLLEDLGIPYRTDGSTPPQLFVGRSCYERAIAAYVGLMMGLGESRP